MELVAYGAQDLHLTGNPQITFFKMIYRRHTNFAIETLEQTFNTEPDFGKKITSTLTRNGDLINRLYLKVELPALPSCSTGSIPTTDEIASMAYWIPKVGHNLIKNASVDIGGRSIDEQSGEWMNIYNDISRPASYGKINNGRFDEMIGNVDGETTYIEKSPLFQTVYFNKYSGSNDYKGSFGTTSPQKYTLDGQLFGVYINGYNQLLSITTGSTTTQVNITKGFYTGYQLANQIKTDVNTALSGTISSCTYNSYTNKITIVFASAFTIAGPEKDDTYGTSTIARILGFDAVSASNTTHTSTNEMKLYNLENAHKFRVLRDNIGNGQNIVEKKTIYIPFQFWFCRHPGLALPIIALSEHDIRVHIELRNLTDLFYGYVGGDAKSVIGTFSSCILYGDYIYLDTEERRRFSQGRHEYLIEQIQSITETVTSKKMKIEIPFNHPVKELIWVVQDDEWIKNTTATATTDTNRGKRYDKEFHQYEIFNSSLSDNSNLRDDSIPIMIKNGNPVLSGRIYVNGQERTSLMDGFYFNNVVPFERHTNIPNSKGINIYSFSLKPEEQQPSGTMNFSKVDSVLLEININKGSSCKVKIYGVNYNILRIMGGMGGVAYSS